MGYLGIQRKGSSDSHVDTSNPTESQGKAKKYFHSQAEDHVPSLGMKRRLSLSDMLSNQKKLKTSPASCGQQVKNAFCAKVSKNTANGNVGGSGALSINAKTVAILTAEAAAAALPNSKHTMIFRDTPSYNEEVRCLLLHWFH